MEGWVGCCLKLKVREKENQRNKFTCGADRSDIRVLLIEDRATTMLSAKGRWLCRTRQM